MSFDWTEFANLADALISGGSSLSNADACFRTAISRSYYAAYCTARNFAATYNSLPIHKDASDHGCVKNHFIHSANKMHKQIGVDLDRLRKDRNKADYDDAVTGLTPMAHKSVTMAREILRTLHTLTPPTTP